MIVNSNVLEGMFEEFKGLADAMFLNYPATNVQELCMYVPTNTISVTYNWLENLPMTRRWMGEKFIKNISASGFSVTSLEYENTIGVRKRDIEADNLGIYRPMISALAAEAKNHPVRLFASLLTNASTTVCFDGQYLIDTDHPVGSTTYSNNTASALSASALAVGRAAMKGRTDDEGRIIGVNPTHLIVPLELEDTALEITQSPVKIGASNATINVLQNSLQVVVLPELTNASAWFLIDASKGVGPVIFQERKAPTFASVTAADDSYVFLNGEYLYGYEADYTFQPGFPQLIYGGFA